MASEGSTNLGQIVFPKKFALSGLNRCHFLEFKHTLCVQSLHKQWGYCWFPKYPLYEQAASACDFSLWGSKRTRAILFLFHCLQNISPTLTQSWARKTVDTREFCRFSSKVIQQNHSCHKTVSNYIFEEIKDWFSVKLPTKEERNEERNCEIQNMSFVAQEEVGGGGGRDLLTLSFTVMLSQCGLSGSLLYWCLLFLLGPVWFPKESSRVLHGRWSSGGHEGQEGWESHTYYVHSLSIPCLRCDTTSCVPLDF